MLSIWHGGRRSPTVTHGATHHADSKAYAPVDKSVGEAFSLPANPPELRNFHGLSAFFVQRISDCLLNILIPKLPPMRVGFWEKAKNITQ
jgi:hypothetical protein